jgi:hypothetical protein
MENRQNKAPKPVTALAPPAGHQLLLSSEQRSLIYERIYRRLSRVDNIWRDASVDGRGRHRRLTQAYEELTFLLKDLASFGDEEIVVSTPPAVVRKVVERLLCEAEDLATEIDEVQAAQENAALADQCKALLVDLDALESQQGSQGVDPRSLPPADRLAQREIVVAVLEALPNQVTAEQIIAERLPYNDCDQSELQRALSVVVELGILELGSAGVIVPSSGLLRINELWENLCAAI